MTSDLVCYIIHFRPPLSISKITEIKKGNTEITVQREEDMYTDKETTWQDSQWDCWKPCYTMLNRPCNIR